MANGSMVDSLDAAVETLASSGAFQSRVGVATSAAAKDHIAFDTLVDNDGLASHRPFAIVKIATRGSNQVGEGVAIDLVAGGGILVYLADNARSNQDHGLSYRDFLTFVGLVIDDMEQDSGFNDYLPFHDSEMVLPPQRTPRDVRVPGQMDYWEVAFLLQYGDRD